MPANKVIRHPGGCAEYIQLYLYPLHSTDTIPSVFSKRIDLMGLMGVDTRHRNLWRGDTGEQPVSRKVPLSPKMARLHSANRNFKYVVK